MARARSAVFQSLGDRCGNGCCASPPSPIDYSTNSRRSTGRRELNCCSEIGSEKAKARKSDSRSTSTKKKYERLQHGRTHFKAGRSWYTHTKHHLINMTNTNN